MTTIELEAQKASLVRDILTEVDNFDLLNKLQKAYKRLKKETVKEEDTISKEEILAGIDAGLREVKQTMEGKLKPKTANEFLYELRNNC